MLFRFSGGKVGFLSRRCSGKGPYVMLKGESRGFLRGLVGSLVFLSNCDSDLRELLMVPMGSQESFRVVKGLSVFLWGLCKVRGPHLVLRWEPQISSPVLTRISGCVCSFKQGVRSRLVWRHGTLLSSRDVKEVSGLQSS